jgi:hypothetical protein
MYTMHLVLTHFSGELTGLSLDHVTSSKGVLLRG